MIDYPRTPDFLGLNRPIGEEYSLTNLVVEGTIPPNIEGVFFRATPDPAFVPFADDDTLLSGDGMISALRIAGGTAGFDMRFVDTPRRRAEVAAGRALFGRYRNPYTDDPSVAGIDRTVANTTPVWHAGTLLMTKEDGRAYRVNPHTLETVSVHDFCGKLKSQTMTAHPRIDPVTGELFFFGYQADGIATTKVAYCIADGSGNLLSEQWFDAPYSAMIHDFAISENYVIFPVYPTIADLDRIKAGEPHWAHHMAIDSWMGVMPRYGDVSEIRWFKGPKGVFAYHLMGAFEDKDGILHLDQCLAAANPFGFIQRAGGIDIPPGQLDGALTRWTVDPKAQSGDVREARIGPPGDFPIIPADRQGRALDHAWMLTMNPDMRGSPLMGGPVYAMFNMLMRLDMRGGPPQFLTVAPNQGFNEPVHVPSSDANHEGWLIAMVDTQLGPDAFEHHAWIINAGDVAAGAVATIAIPKRQRPQVHGCWVSTAQLALAA